MYTRARERQARRGKRRVRATPSSSLIYRVYRHHRHRARRLAVPKNCPRIARLRFPRLEESKSACVHAVLRPPSTTTDRGPAPNHGGAPPEQARLRLAGIFQAPVRLKPPALLTLEGLDSHQKGPFCRYLSPLPDSNRGPPPYHGGFELRLCDAGNALCCARSLQVGWFGSSLLPSLEGP
jgi:hypothetical protein